MPINFSQEITNESERAALDALFDGAYVVDNEGEMNFLGLDKTGKLADVEGRLIDPNQMKGIDVEHAEVFRMDQDVFRQLTAEDQNAFKTDSQFDPRWYKSSAEMDPMDVGFYFVRWTDAEGNAHYCDLSAVIRADLRDDFAAFTYRTATGGGQPMAAASPDPNVTDTIAVVNPGSTQGQAVGAPEFFVPRGDAIDLILGGWTAHVQSGIVYYNFMEGHE